MILPSKHMPADLALLAVGADILAVLDEPMHACIAWDRVRLAREAKGAAPIDFAWFTLALCLLYMLGAVESRGELVVPRRRG